MREMVAAQVAGPKNPNGIDKEISEILGNVAKISDNEEAGHANVMEVDSRHDWVSLIVLPPVQNIDDSHTSSEKDLVVSNLEGVQADY